MNVLFVLYHDFTANSAYHVHSLAKELAKHGDSCAVAVPWKKETIAGLSKNPPYLALDFDDLRAEWNCFPDGRGADMVHAWTPREVVRRFVDEMRSRHSFAMCVHLEDNEWHITERSLRRPWAEMKLLASHELDELIPPHLSHPVRAEAMLSGAHGVSLIMDRLAELVPGGLPTVEFWASADEDLFYPRPLDAAYRAQLGIAPDETVLAYTGNVHASNAHEVRSVYVAVAMLNREGHPARLVRTGRDFVDFLGEQTGWAHQHSIELGFVDRMEMPRVLAAADILVQPGSPGPFNDFRFPSKLPEFLAIGRPVVMPATNIGLRMKHREHAYIVQSVDATAVFDAVVELRKHPELRLRMAVEGNRFFRDWLSWPLAGSKLRDFYGSVLESAG